MWVLFGRKRNPHSSGSPNDGPQIWTGSGYGLSGGEDYELMFTIDPSDVEKVKYLPPISILLEKLLLEKTG
ncbi:MAG: hypothetical protein R2769_10090 [Saprospiraceae bacterium]